MKAAGRWNSCWWGAWLLAAASLVASAAQPVWRPGQAPLMTRWAAQVSPTNVLAEYPRPQLVRPDWLNLNGLWDYVIAPAAEHPPASYHAQILVPFPVESALSGVMQPLAAGQVLWYRRHFQLPSGWQGRRVRLQFGAVDWHCRVWVNGHECGQHRGGYSRFGLDITERLRWNGSEEVVLAVSDPTEGDQPRGKQSHDPEGIFYTPSSGIWQTVWLEPVPEPGIDDLKLTPEVDAQALRLRVGTSTLARELSVEAVALAEGVVAGRVSGPANAELFLRLAQPRLWSPEAPFLYDLRLRLKQGDRVLDEVSSYFGLRQIALVQDDQGNARMALNGRMLFQIGALDQGFWPDGLYTAPTDEALKSDLVFLKQAGFNLARKHVKIEPDRWYYWCDKLGLLVWQDMPSANNATIEGRQEFETELLHMVNDLYNHPSVIAWVLFNEGWGQYDAPRLVQRVKSLDPSRLVNNASGWTDTRTGDMVDAHSYPGPSGPEPEPHRAAVLGEFGGLGLVLEGHAWSSRRWGYQMDPNVETLANSYARLLQQVWNLYDLRGLSAAVFTQVADVETECNGLLTYDRSVAKLEPAQLAAANRGADRVPLAGVLAGDARLGPNSWKYTFQGPAPDWMKPGFDDSGWKQGLAGFGIPSTPGSLVTTLWDTDDIWMRREFSLGQADPSHIRLEIHHDDDAEVYVNGVLAARLKGYLTHYAESKLLPDALKAMQPGTNTLAVHCHQVFGGQYIDVGLVLVKEPPPKPRPEP